MEEDGLVIDQILQIEPVQALLLVSVGCGLVIGADKLAESFSSLHDKIIGRRAKKIIDAQLNGDQALREEIMAMFADSKADHEKYERRFNRDNRRIGALEDAVEKMQEDVTRAHERIDDRADESTIVLKSMSVMMNRMLGLSEDSDIIDSVNEINQYLIERREK